MEMEDASSAAASPFKGLGVSKATIKAELRASHQKLSAHGLMHGAKWAAEQIIGLGDVDEAETQVVPCGNLSASRAGCPVRLCDLQHACSGLCSERF
jgi:hypothetical protein